MNEEGVKVCQTWTDDTNVGVAVQDGEEDVYYHVTYDVQYMHVFPCARSLLATTPAGSDFICFQGKSKPCHCIECDMPDDPSPMAAPARVPTVSVGASQMPAIAFGVGSKWLEDSDCHERIKHAVQSALAAGFRHFDDAETYGMQKPLGEAIDEWMRKTGTGREKLFMTNKAWNMDDDIASACDQVLKNSRLDYFDLYLVHSACKESGEDFKKPLTAIWEEMMSIKRSGKAKEIGVSNWRIKDLESIRDAEIQPVCNQVEAHVFLQQVGLREYCQRRGILMTCYGSQAPIARGCLDETPSVQEAVATACSHHGKDIGQILLRWAYQSGILPVTTSSKIERMRQSLEIFDFELSQEDA